MTTLTDMVQTAIDEAVSDFMGTGPMALAQATLYLHGGDQAAAEDDLVDIAAFDLPLRTAQDRALKILRNYSKDQ
jgi:hypothetical protein